MRTVSRVAALLGCLILSACAVPGATAGPGPGTDGSVKSSRSGDAGDAPAAAQAACLAEAIYFEARGTSPRGQAAVGHVVLNRVEDPEFPDDVCAVVKDGCQFSYRCNGRPNTPANAAAKAEADRIAAEVLNRRDDPTGGALFFHAAQASPGWFRTRPRVGVIGGNVFYR